MRYSSALAVLPRKAGNRADRLASAPGRRTSQLHFAFD